MSKIIITLSVALILTATATASSLDMTITNSTGVYTTANEVGFSSVGGWFDLAITVNPGPNTYFKGLSLFLTESTSAGVMVTARTITGAGPYYYVVDPTLPDNALFGIKSYPHYFDNIMLNPSTADLGVTTRDPNYGDMAGQVMTLRLKVPGDMGFRSLTITAAGSTYVKEDNSAGQFDTLSEIIVVTGVPEPASLALLAFGGLALLRRR